jgi:hypothetical protein
MPGDQARYSDWEWTQQTAIRNTPPPATPLVTGPTIRLPGHHAKVKRDGYIGHRRGGPAPRARLGQRLQTCRFGRQMVKRRNEGQGLGPRG